ncbi:MAG: hypothetical protein M3Q71_05255 [Chloroflexota bacterium]|nr:hypothetical protein [Chloroflexota bacterium]
MMHAATHVPSLTPDLLPADREAAYQLWAHQHQQNAAAVARSLGIPVSTVQSWVRRDGWTARLQAEREDLGRHVWAAAELALLRAVPDGIQALHKIANGEGDTRQVVTKDGEVVEVQEFVPYQARVNAVNSLLDRFGLSSIQRHQHQVQPAPVTSGSTAPPPTHHDHGPAPDLAGPMTRERAAAMTPAERQAWEQARRQQQAG